MTVKKLLRQLLRNNCIERLLTIGLSLFYGYLVILVSIFSIIKHRGKYFQVKRRDAPPDCLNDPTLGEHHFIQLKDIKLHYVSNGDPNKQLMLLIHGFPEFWYSWRNQLRHFSKDYYVVAIDQRGYGDSDKPNSIDNYTIDKLSNDIKQLILALDKSNIILVGHDWGGATAWNVCLRYPELIQSLIILNAPHPKVFREVLKKSWKQFFNSWYMYFFNLPLLPELVCLSNDLRMLEEAFISADGRRLCSAQDIEAYKYIFSKPNSLTCPLNYYRALIRRYPSIPPNSFQIKTPTLIIWGKRDIALTPALAEAGKYCDNLTIHYIENCSHWTQLDQPLLVNQYIQQFLQ